MRHVGEFGTEQWVMKDFARFEVFGEMLMHSAGNKKDGSRIRKIKL